MGSGWLTYGAIFLGGALGSLLREVLTHAVPLSGPVTATFLVNVVACLVIGVVYGLRHALPTPVVLLSAVGFCGGLSTFSGFVAEVFERAVNGQPFTAILAPTLEIAAGILAAALGERLVRRRRGTPGR